MQYEMGQVWQNPIQRTVRTAHLSVIITAQLYYTIQHRTVLIISPISSAISTSRYTKEWPLIRLVAYIWTMPTNVIQYCKCTVICRMKRFNDNLELRACFAWYQYSKLTYSIQLSTDKLTKSLDSVQMIKVNIIVVLMSFSCPCRVSFSAPVQLPSYQSHVSSLTDHRMWFCRQLWTMHCYPYTYNWHVAFVFDD